VLGGVGRALRPAPTAARSAARPAAARAWAAWNSRRSSSRCSITLAFAIAKASAVTLDGSVWAASISLTARVITASRPTQSSLRIWYFRLNRTVTLAMVGMAGCPFRFKMRRRSTRQRGPVGSRVGGVVLGCGHAVVEVVG